MLCELSPTYAAVKKALRSLMGGKAHNVTHTHTLSEIITEQGQ